jgi:predicted dehydrogenase
VIGAGSIGQRHIRNLKALGIQEIVALRSRKGHHQDLETDMGVTEMVSWAELEAAQPDVAVISNPTALHLDTIKRILPLVRGVFVEKPLSHTWDGVPEILGEIAALRRISFVGYNLQFHPVVTTVMEALEPEKFGPPLAFQGVVGHWLPDWHPYEDWRAGYAARKDLGGGAALTLIHELRMALSWFGTVERVIGESRGSESLETDVDVNTNLMLRHSTGATTQLHLDLLQKPYHRQGVISCERGWIRYDFTSPAVTAQSHEDEMPSVLWSDPAYDPNESYILMMNRFLQYVREGRVRHDFDAWSGAEDLSVVVAGYESEGSRRWEAPSRP